MPPAAAIAQDEILTGEAVALDVQPIGYFLRAVGVLIDMLAYVAVLLTVALATTWLGGAGVLAVELAPALTIAALVVALVVLPTVVETATRGRSLGKLAIGARIVRTDGGAAGFRHALIRALVGVLELWLTVGAVAGVVAVFTPRAERLGDLVAGTYSERTRTPRLPPDPPPMPAALGGWATIADIARLPAPLARRIAQFVRGAADLEPAVRARTARAPADEAAAFVWPVPPVDPDMFVHGVAALRRDRDLRALRAQSARTAALTAGAELDPARIDAPSRR